MTKPMIITGMDDAYDVHLYCEDCEHLRPTCQTLSVRIVDRGTNCVIRKETHKKSDDRSDDWEYFNNLIQQVRAEDESNSL